MITGASSGIGEAVARSLLERGLTVVTLQRSAPRIKHPNLHFRQIDLSDLEATKALERESGFITGQALFVCGGTSITGTGGA